MKNLIKKFRENMRFSQKTLAKKAGISRTYVIQLENGRSIKPSAEVLYRIAKVLNVKMEDFFEATPDTLPKKRTLSDVVDHLEGAIRELNKLISK